MPRLHLAILLSGTVLLLTGILLAWLLPDPADLSPDGRPPSRAADAPHEPEGPGLGGYRELHEPGSTEGHDDHDHGPRRPEPPLFATGRAYIASRETPVSRGVLAVHIRGSAFAEDRRVPTGPEGEFHLRALEPGTYTLVFEHTSCRPVAVAVVLAEDEPLTGLEIVFERSAAVWGVVFGPDEDPAPGMLLEWSLSQHALHPLETSTDAAGRYEIAALDPGRYFVRIVPRLLRAAWEAAPLPQQQVVVRRDGPNRFDFTSPAARALPVRIRGARGRTLAGIEVEFRLQTAERGIAGFLPPTGADGRTELRGLPAAGRLTLRAPGAEAVELELSEGPAEAMLDLR